MYEIMSPTVCVSILLVTVTGQDSGCSTSIRGGAMCCERVSEAQGQISSIWENIIKDLLTHAVGQLSLFLLATFFSK